MNTAGSVEVYYKTGLKGGLAHYPNSCMQRTFRSLLEEGKPTGKMTILSLRPHKGLDRVIGTLVHSPGRRLIFFPGLVERTFLADSLNRKHKMWDKKIDHLTVESDLDSWHLTTEDQKHRLSARCHKRTENVIHLFSFSLAMSTLLEIVPTETSFSVPGPVNDLQRRAELVAEAREAVDFHLIDISSLPVLKNSYLHFDFIADRTLRPLHTEVEALAQAGGPWFLDNVQGPPTNGRIITNDIILPGFRPIIVVNAYFRNGRLPKPVIFSSEKELPQPKQKAAAGE